MRFSPAAATAVTHRATWRAGLTAAIWLAAACANAAPLFGEPTGPLATIRIVERASGKVLPVYRHQGEYWVAGRPGANYAVRVHNATEHRIMGVISVDGLNILTGKRAAARPDDGYVFDAGEAADIEGWRKSLDQIAAFYFSESAMSYASRTGRPQDVGVIGVALFREKAPAVIYEPSYPSLNTPNTPRSSAEASAATADAAAPMARQTEKSASRSAPAAPAPSLGTGHGAIETSRVATTSFDSATTRPEQLVQIRYDSYANLVAKGVIPKPPPPRVQRKPRPFPDDGFVVDPPAL